MSIKNMIELPESIDNAVKNISDLPTKNVGQTLSDCWFLVFGGISQLSQKRKLKYAKELELFKLSLEEKIDLIPEINRVEANTQSAMSALENVKYCVEEDELREMFANLISATLDNRRNFLVHPSFADILKTLTPLDAQNLLLINQEHHLPICDVIRVLGDNERSVLLKNLFLMNPECKIYEQQSLSISSLLKNGLIEIPISEKISGNDIYTIYHKCDEILQIQEAHPEAKLGLLENLVRLTPLGFSFLDICCPD